MIEVVLSEHSVAAARKLDELHESGELFGPDGYLRSGPAVEAASREFLDSVTRDLLLDIAGPSDSSASLHLLNPEKPPGLARYHRGGGLVAHLKVELGGGWCAYGHVSGGACWYDGIGRC
jgi:hypothetical protein